MCGACAANILYYIYIIYIMCIIYIYIYIYILYNIYIYIYIYTVRRRRLCPVRPRSSSVVRPSSSSRRRSVPPSPMMAPDVPDTRRAVIRQFQFCSKNPKKYQNESLVKSSKSCKIYFYLGVLASNSSPGHQTNRACKFWALERIIS